MRKRNRVDSLAGRSVWLYLFPVSFREYVMTCAPHIELDLPWKGESSLTDCARGTLYFQKELRKLWDDYVRFGSFPENLTRKDPVFYKQWLENYLSAMLERDLKGLHVKPTLYRQG